MKAAMEREEKVSANQVVPLYHQIYLILRQNLLDGRYDSQPLPSEMELTEQYKVSRVTIRRAMQDLVNEGLIARGRGKGTFANRPLTAEPTKDAHDADGLLGDMMKMPTDCVVSVLDVALVTASTEVCEALKLAEGATVQKATRMRTVGNLPIAHLTTFVPERFSRGFGRRELEQKASLRLLEENGIEVASASQTISAKLADANVARHLNVQVGAPLLYVLRVTYDKSGLPVQLLRGYYRPDRFEYRMQLSRDGADKAKMWTDSEALV